MKLVSIQKLIGICHSERPEGAKNLSFIGEITKQSEIPLGPAQGGLRRYSPQNDMLVRVNLT